MFRIEFHRKNQESGFVECGVVTKLEISLCIDGLKKKQIFTVQVWRLLQVCEMGKYCVR
jgi:hypothetical protein